MPLPQKSDPTVVLLTLRETRARSAIGMTKLYSLLASGELEGVKLGNSTRVIEASLNRYLSGLPRWQPAAAPVAARKGGRPRRRGEDD